MKHNENTAETSQTAYYAVIFTSRRSGEDRDYEKTAQRMLALASRQPGFLGVESVRDRDGAGITISYWEDLQAIDAWKQNTEHREAQKLGKAQWYESYKIRICKVERAYDFNPGK